MPGTTQLIFGDFTANAGSPQSQLILLMFRISNLLWKIKRQYPSLGIFFWPYSCFYIVLIHWFFHCELFPATTIGPGLCLPHTHGIVINEKTVIGRNVKIRHSVTIGNAEELGACPRIGDSVDIGAGAILLGSIEIGEGAKIGAGSVVVKDVAANDVVAGVPARTLRRTT